MNKAVRKILADKNQEEETSLTEIFKLLRKNVSVVLFLQMQETLSSEIYISRDHQLLDKNNSSGR